MSYETKPFRLVKDRWLKLSVSNAGLVEIQARGAARFAIVVDTAEPAASFRSDLVYQKASFQDLGDATVWARAVDDDCLITILRMAASANLQPVILQPLLLSARQFAVGSAADTVIGNFTTRTAGSSISLKRPTGSVALKDDLSGVNVGPVPADVGTFTEVFVETHELALNSGLETEIEFRVLRGASPPATSLIMIPMSLFPLMQVPFAIEGGESVTTPSLPANALFLTAQDQSNNDPVNFDGSILEFA